MRKSNTYRAARRNICINPPYEGKKPNRRRIYPPQPWPRVEPHHVRHVQTRGKTYRPNGEQEVRRRKNQLCIP